VPYKGEYIQVTGKPLNERYNMKAVGGAERVNRKIAPAVSEG